MSIMTQQKAILKHLSNGQTITPIEALSKFRCFRLSGRIFELRRQGHNGMKVFSHQMQYWQGFQVFFGYIVKVMKIGRFVTTDQKVSGLNPDRVTG